MKTRHTYQFDQTTPSTTWNIVHNLNLQAPIVDCWVLDMGVMTKIIPYSVQRVDENTVLVTFTSPRSGRALVL
jgi:hypothetical protein